MSYKKENNKPSLSCPKCGEEESLIINNIGISVSVKELRCPKCRKIFHEKSVFPKTFGPAKYILTQQART